MPEQEEGNHPSQEEKEEGVQTKRRQEGVGDGPRAPTACRTSPDEGEDPPVRQRALPAHGMLNQEEGNPPSQEEEEEGAPHEQRALPAHDM